MSKIQTMILVFFLATQVQWVLLFSYLGKIEKKIK